MHQQARRRFVGLCAAGVSSLFGGGFAREPHQERVSLRGGRFQMGSASRFAKPNEKPVHWVELSSFSIDRTHVTNRLFGQFVQETGYVTTAEIPPKWEELAVQLPPDTPRPPPTALVAGGMVYVGQSRPRFEQEYLRAWAFVPGATWRKPLGPQSGLNGLEDHPVVQVSYVDAMAYALWCGRGLPTEAQFEYAARGGLVQKDFAWGDRFRDTTQEMAQTWENDRLGGRTTAVGSFPANGYGLFDMSGNVWQWCSDWYRSDAFVQRSKSGRAVVNPGGPLSSYTEEEEWGGAPPQAPKRVIRGGSFLCHRDYCMGYRPSARRGMDPFSSMSHVGFRTVSR